MIENDLQREESYRKVEALWLDKEKEEAEAQEEVPRFEKVREQAAKKAEKLRLTGHHDAAKKIEDLGSEFAKTAASKKAQAVQLEAAKLKLKEPTE